MFWKIKGLQLFFCSVCQFFSCRHTDQVVVKFKKLGNAISANFGTRGGGTLWCNSCSRRQWCCWLFPEIWFLRWHCSQQPVEVNGLKYYDYTYRKNCLLFSSQFYVLTTFFFLNKEIFSDSFSELAEQFTNCTLMAYLPAFSGECTSTLLD